MKNLKKKKGFTLIELMIVLAIIGILAVVLVPKISTMKNSARDTGITTNVNSVRAYLETKTNNKFISTSVTLETTMDRDFNDELENPITNLATISNDNNSAPTTAPAVYIYEAVVEPAETDPVANYVGSVIVRVDATNKSYAVYEIPRGASTFADVSAPYIVR